jgi:hypothetical protein
MAKKYSIFLAKKQAVVIGDLAVYLMTHVFWEVTVRH